MFKPAPMRYVFVLLTLVILSPVALAEQKSYIRYPYQFRQTPQPFSTHLLKKDKSDSASGKSIPGILDKIDKFMVKYVIWGPFPIITFGAETNWLFGLTKFNSFTIRNGDTLDTETQASTVSELAYYTLNNQYKFVVGADIMFYKNKYLWTTAFVYEQFPLRFYGTGNNTDLNDEQVLNTRNLQITTKFLFKTVDNLYIGGRYDFFDYYDVSFDTLLHPEDSLYLEEQKGIQSGFGPALRYEGRDNRFNARKGFFVLAEYQLYTQALGSNFNYQKFVGDFRYYITPLQWLTMGWQFYTEWRAGDVPVQSLALLGGSSRLRGVYEGRFRDKTMLEMQMELRFPIYWIFRGVVFGGMGQAAPEYSKLGTDQFHFAGGAGLRVRVDPIRDINIRIDFGWSKDFFGVYFGFTEAF